MDGNIIWRRAIEWFLNVYRVWKVTGGNSWR